DRLHADDLLARLGTGRVIGRQIEVFLETASTNDIVDKLGRDGVEEGVVVFAESQSRGRGRLGRTWASPAGKGLWFSVLLRPRMHPTAATRLTVMAAVAVARAIERQTGLHPAIKWPNDLLLGTRKCAGILLELSAELDHIRQVVLGIGLDVNAALEDFPSAIRTSATSLASELGRPVDRPSLAAAVLEELEVAYVQLQSDRFAVLADEWVERGTTLGRRVNIRVGSREISGIAECLDDDGTLLVRTEHGRLERVVGGDVTLHTAA
ncbi:MAG TPA: biotin--[acetyl-CoA-carboxylase] ligase, partial [Verrucomicrobiales bacterium]|nr:biotin--[acetyl-CoA-carboxylase] ligase [Verrucomicrobiales bacterium]